MAYSRILVPLDGSKLAESALQHAVRIAKPGARIHLVSVMALDRVSEIDLLSTAISDKTPYTEQQWPPVKGADDAHADQARAAYLRRVSEFLSYADYDVTFEVLQGNAVEEISRVANSGQFDVVTLATHARGGIDRVAMGSVAEAVLRRVNLPVLIVPPAKMGESEGSAG